MPAAIPAASICKRSAVPNIIICVELQFLDEETKERIEAPGAGSHDRAAMIKLQSILELGTPD